MKKNRITEIVLATILILSLAASYKYYVTDKKNQSDNMENTTVESTESAGESKNMLVEMEDDEFTNSQVKELGEALILYGSVRGGFMENHTTDHFQFEFNDFEVYERLPDELLGEECVSNGNSYNEDGTMKDDNTCVAKVSVKITNMSDKPAETAITGFQCYKVDEKGEYVKTGTNKGSIFLDSYKGKDNLTSKDCAPRLMSGESFSDVVYFIVDKLNEESTGYMIKVDPRGMSEYRFDKLKNAYIKNNGYGYVKIKYTDIIKN